MARLAGLKKFFTKDIMPKKERPRFLTCKKCGGENELPYGFCEHCGAPRVRLGRFRITLNLTITLAAFFATFYFSEIFAWPWAIYTLYSLFLLQIALLFVAESQTRRGRFAFWYVLFLGGGGLIYQELFTEGPYFFVLVLGSLPEIIMDNPHISIPVIGFLFVVGVLPLYFRWIRLYGWVNSYRIVLLSVFCITAGTLLFLRGAEFLYAKEYFPDLHDSLKKLVTEVAPDYTKLLKIGSVTVLRVFLFEVFVFAAIRGYAVSGKQTKKIDKSVLAKETGINKSLLLIAQIFARFGHALEQMVRYLIETLIHLARDLGKVIYAFLRELLVPSLMLVTASLVILKLAQTTIAYIDDNTLLNVAIIMGCVLSLVVSEMVFLGCKSRYRWARVVGVHGQLFGWLLPNFLIFFLLISVSLFASAAVLGGEEEGAHTLPFYLGMLTKAVGALLAFMVAVIMLRKRSLLLGASTAEATDEKEGVKEDDHPPLFDEDNFIPQEEIDADAPAGEEEQKPETEPKARKKRRWDIGHRAAEVQSRTAVASEKLASFVGAAKDAVSTSQFGQAAKKQIGGMQERVQGKPEIIVKIEKVKAEYAEVMRQIEGLDKTRDSLAQATYESLLLRYQEQAEEVVREMNKLQATIDEEYMENARVMTELDGKVQQLTQQREEQRALFKAGGIKKHEYDTQERFLTSQIQYNSGALANRRKRQQFLEPHAKVGESVEG